MGAASSPACPFRFLLPGFRSNSHQGGGDVVYRFLADMVVLLHFGFVLFVVLGGFLALWKPVLAWYHVPAAIWGAAIEFFGWICPLTHLENMLRAKGGVAAYGSGFIDTYIMPLLYPADLTQAMHIGLGLVVLGVNTVIYWRFWHKHRGRGKAAPG